MDADCGRDPRNLLDDGCVAEDAGVKLGCLVCGTVAPDGGGDELIHTATVSDVDCSSQHSDGVPRQTT